MKNPNLTAISIMQEFDREQVVNLIADLFIKIVSKNNCSSSSIQGAADSLQPSLQSLKQEIVEMKEIIAENRKLLTAEEAAKYLRMSLSSLYKLTSALEIPHSKPTGRLLYFDKDEITTWALGKKNINPKKEAEKILQNRK